MTDDCLALQAVTGTLDGILDTVSAKHDLALYLALLKVNGVIVMLGVPDEPLDLPLFNIIMRKSLDCTLLLSEMAACCGFAFFIYCTQPNEQCSPCKKVDTQWYALNLQAGI